MLNPVPQAKPYQVPQIAEQKVPAIVDQHAPAPVEHTHFGPTGSIVQTEKPVVVGGTSTTISGNSPAVTPAGTLAFTGQNQQQVIRAATYRYQFGKDIAHCPHGSIHSCN